MDFFLYSLLNGLSLGLLLFLLASGLSLVYGLMGVLNFAHASFYMLGAYIAYSISAFIGWTASLVIAPLLVGLIGLGFELVCLRRVYSKGHAAEMLLTFGFAYVVLEMVQLLWGKSALPAILEPFWTRQAFAIGVFGVSQLKVLMMSVSLLIAICLMLFLRWSRTGLVIEAALSHPQTLSTLGYNLALIKTIVFTAGCVLAGLAGVLGGQAFVTEPSMALNMGVMGFVIIVLGGLGSVAGAFWVALAIGLLQTMVLSYSTWASWGAALPFILLALSLLLRAKGLMGVRSAST
jgi:branched-chain amino acid transport system permease protein